MFEKKRVEGGTRGTEQRLKVSLLTGAISLCLLFSGCMALPRRGAAPDLPAQIRNYRAEAVRLRGLPLAKDIAVEEEKPDAMTASFAQELDKPENRAFMDETESLLRQFRLLHPDVSLRSLYLKLLKQQVAAYYDTEKKRLAYVRDNVAAQSNGADMQAMRPFIYVHEFCHAVEDARFDLDGLTKASMADFDQNLAQTSFVEGNAVLIGMDGLLDENGLPVNTTTPLSAWLVRLLAHIDSDKLSSDLDGVPPFLAGALIRPYLDGTVFSNRIRRDHGWRGIDEVYTSRIPQTTAEIIYPERRYLNAFRPARFIPDKALFRFAVQGVATNRLGVLGTAFWLGGSKMVTAGDYGVLKGWMGDQVYLLKGKDGVCRTVWVSAWERPGMARSFRRLVARRMKERFGDVVWSVRSEGRLVAAVWDSSGAMDRSACDVLTACALQTRVEADFPSLCASWFRDCPWPLRFPSYKGMETGCEVLGGYVTEIKGGPDFFRMSLVSGALRTETTPDRHYYGALWGLLRHVKDERSDFTYWKIPVLAAWHRRGSGAERQYRWTAVWGLLASGDDRRVRVLFVPVWHAD